MTISLTGVKRLLVTRQDPTTRRFSKVGELSVTDEHGYAFVYDEDADRPLPGLPMTSGRTHHSAALWSIFAERVMHPERPDYNESLDRLGLGLEAAPFEVLTVSGGRRTGDTYELTPIPEVGAVELPFLVHGIRHLAETEIRAIDDLAVGQRLALRPEPDNPVNDRALVVTRDETRLGFVPDALVEHMHRIRLSEHDLRVERVNPAAAGFHLRLLVVLSGTYTVDGG